MAEEELPQEEPAAKFELSEEVQNKPLSVSEAARILSAARHQAEAPKTAEAPAQPEPETPAQPVDAAPPEVPGAEKTETTEEAETPIDPPRSWKADEKERFRSLPRETQEYLLERETERDRALSRSQNEAAEKLKGLSAKELAVEQARQQYEAALPQLFQVLQSQQAGEFADIKTIQDVEKLAREDWPRYLQWDVAQKKIAAVQQEMQASEARQRQEKLQKFAEFATKEDQAFAEKVPEVKDPAKYKSLQENALDTLKNVGFTDQELSESWTGQKDVSLRDSRLQLLIRDATLYRMQQKARPTLVANRKPVPPVQRPGTAQPANAAATNNIKQLEERLANSTGNAALRLAVELQQAKRKLAG